MYPGSANPEIYNDGLLQAQDVVSHQEVVNQANQIHDDKHNPCLRVVKNGRATGTTTGFANGLRSVQRKYKNYNTGPQDSYEYAVIPDNMFLSRPFSDSGDSGSIVLTREGKILGMLTGGAGPPESTDVSFVTPFWRLLELIKRIYPNAQVYPQVYPANA